MHTPPRTHHAIDPIALHRMLEEARTDAARLTAEQADRTGSPVADDCRPSMVPNHVLRAAAEREMARARIRRAVRGLMFSVRLSLRPSHRRDLLAAARVIQRTDARRTWTSLFDPVAYWAANPDVAAANLPPSVHYLLMGYREGRDPSAGFSTAQYLHRNEDVRQAHLNPLVHYALFGSPEGRAIAPSAAGWPDGARQSIEPSDQPGDV